MRSTSISSNVQTTQRSNKMEIKKITHTEKSYADQLVEQEKALENKQHLVEKVLDRYEGIKMSYAAAQRNLRNIEIAKWVQKKGDKAKPEQKPEYNTKQKQSSALRDFAKSLFQ